MITNLQTQERKKKIYLIIHGHFYQPSRESPWTQTIPLQESAKPFRDWNERITAQCYNPNTRSRVLDAHGKILYLVNNFAYINFNIGPTLFSWIEKHHPDVYKRIIEADRRSCEHNNGHGNAIAQVYNHIILPLANEWDLETQIIWGKREFQYRFGRDPEAMWLSETAINQATVKCLIEHGIKYVILSPTQASRVRRVDGEEWDDVSHNSIDTTQPYRLFIESDAHLELDNNQTEQVTINNQHSTINTQQSRRYLDIFFYDGPLARDISFNHLLRDANTFARRVYDVANTSSAPYMLIHVATDGEVYGHHEPYADMCLASSMILKFPALQIEITNYARYLELHPPTMEVELKSGGDNDEGTAWSCAHGVGRWYQDCGCSIGHVPGWNQQWRTPLRKGFDVLRDTLAELFEELGGSLLRDPWDARDKYIECILDPSTQTVNAFLEKHAIRPLTDEEQSIVLRLLEAQKYSMFAYTSCAWFFDDISGLEVQQNMRYAARAAQLAEGLDPQIDFEALMLAEFEKGKSNMPAFGTGKDFYLRYVQPEIYTPERAANQLLLENLTSWKEQNYAAKYFQQWIKNKKRQMHIYTVQCLDVFTWNELLESDGTEKQAQSKPQQEQIENLRDGQKPIISGLLKVRDTLTRQTWLMLFTMLMERSAQSNSYLKQVEDETQLSGFRREAGRFKSHTMSEAGFISNLPQFLEEHGFNAYGLADLYEDDRERLFFAMIQDHVERTYTHIQALYQDSLELLNDLTRMNVRIPAQLRASVEFALSHQLVKEMEKLYVSEDVESQFPALLSSELEEILRLSQLHHLELDTTLLQDHLSRALTRYLSTLSQRLSRLEQVHRQQSEIKEAELQKSSLNLLNTTLKLLEKAEKLGVVLDKTELQNIMYDMIENTMPYYICRLKKRAEQQIAEQMGNNVNTFQERSRHFSEEFTFIKEYFKLAEQLNLNIERYRQTLISSELVMGENPDFWY